MSALTLEEICTAALELADQSGVTNLTMRRLARQLGVAPMTLYGRLASRDELLEYVTEYALDTLQVPDVGRIARWDDAIVELMSAFRDLLREHPGIVQILISRRVISRSDRFAILVNQVIACLSAGSLDENQIIATWGLILAFTLGYVAYEGPRLPSDPRDDLDSRTAISFKGLAEREGLPYVLKYAEQIATVSRVDRYRDGLRALLASAKTDRH